MPRITGDKVIKKVLTFIESLKDIVQEENVEFGMQGTDPYMILPPKCVMFSANEGAEF